MRQTSIKILVFCAFSIASHSTAGAGEWFPSNGLSCLYVCGFKGKHPVYSGPFFDNNRKPTGQDFMVCAGDVDGSGSRPGFNLAPNWTDACYVAWGSKSRKAKPFSCLCE